jgi:hypothetical protein
MATLDRKSLSTEEIVELISSGVSRREILIMMKKRDVEEDE